jgi:ankyrin repeat protein
MKSNGLEYCDKCGKGLMMSFTCPECERVICDTCSGLTTAAPEVHSWGVSQTLGGGQPTCPFCAGPSDGLGVRFAKWWHRLTHGPSPRSQRAKPGVAERQQRNQALLKACKDGDPSQVESLLRDEADVNCEGEYQMTPLRIAAGRGALRIAELLLGKKANVNFVGPYGDCALRDAIGNGSTEIMRLLIAHGADANVASSVSRENVLHWAVQQDEPNEAAIQMLVDNGANLKAANVDGQTPLDMARKRGSYNEFRPKIVEILSRGPDPKGRIARA